MTRTVTAKHKATVYFSFGFIRHLLLLFLSLFYSPIYAEAVDLKETSATTSSASQNEMHNVWDFLECPTKNINPCRSKCHKRPHCVKGPPGCPGAFTNYASYQLFIMPDQEICPIQPHTPIAFRRQIVNKGFTIISHHPFRTFELVPGIYEITLGISTDAKANQIQIVVGSKKYTFTPYSVNADFLTFTKTIEIPSPTKVRVITTKGLSFPNGSYTGLAAYINFIRLE